MDNKDSIIHKIKKLIEKANSTDSIQEAESCMLLVQTLLQKHNLEQSIIESHISQSEKGEQITEISFKYSDDFEPQLLHAISQNNFCYCINDIYKTPKELILIGKSVNTQSVLYLFNFFKLKLQQLSISSYSNYLKEQKEKLAEFGVDFSQIKSGRKALEKNYMNNYLTGGVHGIRSKMMKQIEEAKQNSSGLKELILFNDKSIEKYVKENHRVKKSKGKKVNTDNSAYHNGYKDGSEIKTSVGIDSNKGTSNVLKQLN